MYHPDLSKVTKMAVLSGNSYKYTSMNKLPPKSIKRYSRGLIYTNTDKKEQVVVVRGSMLWKRPEDVLMNINIQSQVFHDYKIHKGFFNEAMLLYKKLQSDNVIVDDYKLEFTGHSSGGCIACILAMMMQEDKDNIGDVITFGQPKFVKHMYGSPIQCTRVVNIADPIPILPICEYKHMGEPLIIDENNQGNVPRLADHEMRSYINNLVLNFVRPI